MQSIWFAKTLWYASNVPPKSLANSFRSDSTSSSLMPLVVCKSLTRLRAQQKHATDGQVAEQFVQFLFNRSGILAATNQIRELCLLENVSSLEDAAKQPLQKVLKVFVLLLLLFPLNGTPQKCRPRAFLGNYCLAIATVLRGLISSFSADSQRNFPCFLNGRQRINGFLHMF